MTSVSNKTQTNTTMTASAYLTPKPNNNASHLPICPSPPRREASRALHEVSICQPMPFPTLNWCMTDEENSDLSSTGCKSNKNKPLAIRLKPRPSKYRPAAKISKSGSGKNAVHSMSRSTSGKALHAMTRSASYQYLMGSSSKPRSSLPRRPSFHSRAA